MAIVIALSNHKGGVGKTTSAANIGAGLNTLGERVLLVDVDPQANLTENLGIEEPESTSYDMLHGKKVSPITLRTGLDLIPSTLDLSGAEMELHKRARREYVLRDSLTPYLDQYDFIFIDAPPSLGLLTVNALTAADRVFIPIQAQYFALKGIRKITEVINQIKEELNPSLQIGGIIVTQYDGRLILGRNILDAVSADYKRETFKTIIRQNVALAEAPVTGQDIFRYAPKSSGAEDYLSLCKEILQRVKESTL
jgi:chromosome partitioning protein